MPLSLFQAYGVELEYMIVDGASLAVRPIADRVLEAAAGHITSEVELGEIAWSNELALHVIELKTNGPAQSLEPLPELFQEQIGRINAILEKRGARLMPSAMHPWMDPDTELRLWPHDYNPVYEAYNRIFDCRGHGWANLQSVHLNLPFADDEEFGRLHAAIRLLLPILPALAASSPIVERRASGMQDTRLEVYRKNSQRIPSITGSVIPEPVFTRTDYERQIFQRMYADIAPFDPEKILQQEFLNSRGAIARFDRQTIEIRVLDVQECPLADLAICAAVSGVLQAMCGERWTSAAEQQSLSVAPLAAILLASIWEADAAVIDDERFLAQFGYAGASATANELWRHLVESTMPAAAPWQRPLATILDRGPLSRRIMRALGSEAPSQDRLDAVYRDLCACLAEGTPFLS
jgi:gamma-glutamyl:cysteine ligase YbdK (ATP-grasp superfamily)